MKKEDILKIFGIWYGVSFVFVLFFMFFIEQSNIINVENLLTSLLTPFIVFFCVILAFAPAIAVLFFLFKKIKSSKLRIFLIAFIIPFTNLIYLIIGNCFSKGFTLTPYIIGFCTLFVFLPITFVTFLLTPKSLLHKKWQFIITSLLMWIFGWVLIFLTALSEDYISNKMDLLKLKRYQPIIETLEQHKVKNGVYPDNVADSVKLYKNFSYKPLNNNKDFMLTVGDEYYFEFFNYCTDVNTKGCHEGQEYPIEYTKIGNWIKAVNLD